MTEDSYFDFDRLRHVLHMRFGMARELNQRYTTKNPCNENRVRVPIVLPEGIKALGEENTKPHIYEPNQEFLNEVNQFQQLTGNVEAEKALSYFKNCEKTVKQQTQVWIQLVDLKLTRNWEDIVKALNKPYVNYPMDVSVLFEAFDVVFTRKQVFIDFFQNPAKAIEANLSLMILEQGKSDSKESQKGASGSASIQ